MLVQSFLSADDLGITEPQRDALIKTLVLLETGKLVHAPNVEDKFYPQGDVFTGAFNMNHWKSLVHGCGTVACIGGTAELISGVSLPEGDVPDNLYWLFHPELDSSAWNDITPAQAACALRSYLNCGEAKWSEAVA